MRLGLFVVSLVSIIAASFVAVPIRPAAAQDDDVVELPAEGEVALRVLRDGRRVWAVNGTDGEVSVLDVRAERLDPDADPYVYGSAFEGVLALTTYFAPETLFIGGGTVFDVNGVAQAWGPNQVGGAEDAQPIEVADMARYENERVDAEHVQIGDRIEPERRTVPPESEIFGGEESDFIRPETVGEPISVEEALAAEPGMTMLVDADLEGSGLLDPRLCDIPDVPVPDYPSCPEDAPVPVDVSVRDPQAGVQLLEFGPALVTRTAEGLADLALSGGSAGSSIPPVAQSGLGFDEDPTDVDVIRPGPLPEGASALERAEAVAVAISRTRFADGTASDAVVVRGDDPADATIAGSLTRYGPLLYTGRDSIGDATLAELDRVLGDQGTTIRLVGGPAAISDAVVDQLRAAGWDVERLGGDTRVQTSLAVARASGSSGETLIARADAPPQTPSAAWADVVTAGGYAGIFQAPILLTPGAALHPDVAAYLSERGTEDLTLIGGEAALSAAVEDALPGARRIAGPNRAGTAAAIADQLWQATSGRAIVFDGYAAEGWQAGLAAAGLSTTAFAPLLLAIQDGTLPSETATAITALCPFRGADVLAIDVQPNRPGCGPPASPDISVTVDVDSRRDTPEEDARIEVTVTNDGNEPVEIGELAVSDESLDSPFALYRPLVTVGFENSTVSPGSSVDLSPIDPLPVSPLNGGATSAGRYQAAVLVDDAWHRETFFVEFSDRAGLGENET